MRAAQKNINLTFRLKHARTLFCHLNESVCHTEGRTRTVELIKQQLARRIKKAEAFLKNCGEVLK